MGNSLGLGSGFEVANKAIEEAKANNPNANTAFRFRLANKSSAFVIFLEDEPALVAEEHSLYVNKRVYNLVCPGTDVCPLCAAGGDAARKSIVGYFSVIRVTATPKEDVEEPRYPDPENLDDASWEEDWDIREEIRRNKGEGALVLNPVQLLPAKSGTLGILGRQAEKREGLRGALFEVARGADSKSPAVGDNWDFESKLESDMVVLLNPDAEPLDYEEALDIRTPEQLREFANGNTEKAAEADRSGGGDSEKPKAAATSKGKPATKNRRLSW